MGKTLSSKGMMEDKLFYWGIQAILTIQVLCGGNAVMAGNVRIT